MHITNSRSSKPNRIWLSPSLFLDTATLLVLLMAFGLAGLLKAQSSTHVKALRLLPPTPAGQEFFCVGPYSVSECETQTALLRAVLRNYDAERLGKWNWILIRSEDWKQFVSQLNLDPASPAFSHLGYRQSFFDEALLVLKPKRELELVTKWKVSFDRFLDLAVSHELGHAFCQESDEIKAERFGQHLRKHLPDVCESKKQQNILAQDLLRHLPCIGGGKERTHGPCDQD
jgi:hypothetical protein